MSKAVERFTSDKHKSRFTPDGSYIKRTQWAKTVGELRELLANYPDALPISNSRGCFLVWFNVGEAKSGFFEHLSIDDDDTFGVFDDED